MPKSKSAGSFQKDLRSVGIYSPFGNGHSHTHSWNLITGRKFINMYCLRRQISLYLCIIPSIQDILFDIFVHGHYMFWPQLGYIPTNECMTRLRWCKSGLLNNNEIYISRFWNQTKRNFEWWFDIGFSDGACVKCTNAIQQSHIFFTKFAAS